MKKLISTFILSACLCSLSANDGNESDLSTYNISLEAGYTSQLVVNGVAKHGDGVPYMGFGFNKPLTLANVYGSAKLVPEPNGDTSQSHWTIGLSKTLAVGDWGLEVAAEASRHQHGVWIPDSTELAAGVALVNPWVTPYVKAVTDLDLDQDGYALGVKKAFTLGGDSLSLSVTPVVEWYKFTDYDSFVAGIDLSASVQNGFFSHFQPFGSIAYVDSDIDGANFNFASHHLDGDVNATVGLKYSF